MTWFVFVMIALQPISMLASEKVYVYNWTEYIPDAVLAAIYQETGIKVIYSTYESNETMYAKLKLIQGEGYDLVFPSTYFVSKMSKEGMLQPLDHALLPNMQRLIQDTDGQGVRSRQCLFHSVHVGFNGNWG